MKNSIIIMLISTLIFSLFSGYLCAQTIWQKYEQNPVLTPGESGEWESNIAAITSIIREDSVYKAWYIGVDGEDVGRVGYASSPDGISWSKYNQNPILVPGNQGEWDSMNSDHACVLLVDGVYRMWYMGENESSAQIGYATSNDGINWQKYAGNPVLKLGDTGSWDASEVLHPSVIYDGTTYHMWYNGFGQDLQRTGYATSLDGINWTKFEGNPVMHTGDSGSWDDYMLALMAIIYKDGEFKMWYTAGDGTVEDQKYFRIGYATSPDGETWTKYQENPVLNIGEAGTWDSIGVVTSAVLFDSMENKYKMWYGGINGSHGQTGYATSDIASRIMEFTDSSIPDNFILHQNYPNPFNPVTAIGYRLPAVSQVDLSIFNILGQRIATLVSEQQNAGSYQVEWDAGRDQASGVYYYQLVAGEYRNVMKMILLR